MSAMEAEVELNGETYIIIDGVLDLYNTRVTDLSPLRGIPLRELYLSNTPAAKQPLPEWLDRSIVRGLY